ncbi:MAG: hypothetical protein OEQ29_02350 [Alphaproteobacteria bacterium]|nr:hypothetical protein [Alphaproteobacteria bacterium]
MFIEIETAGGRRIINSTFIISVEPRDSGCAVLVASGDDVEDLTTDLSYEAIKSGLQFGGVEVVTRQSEEASLTTLRPVATD